MAGDHATLRRCSALVMLALGVLAAAWPSAAPASDFRRLAASVVAFWSDGSRYALWQTQKGSAVTVYDTLTRHRGEVMLPPECQVEDGWAGRLLLGCNGNQRLLDLRSGQVTTLSTGPFEVGWTTVGLRYLEGRADKTACRESSSEIARRRPCLALYEEATGAVSYRPQSQVADLDRPGAPPVCRRLRNTVVGFEEEKGEGQYIDGLLVQLVQIGEARPTRIRISHCHGPPTIVRALTGRNFPENLELAGGVLTWDSGQPGTGYFDAENLGEDFEHGVLWSYDIASRRREKWTLPRSRLVGETPEGRRPLGVLGSSAHTRQAVFWLATRTLQCDKLCDIASSSVYMALK